MRRSARGAQSGPIAPLESYAGLPMTLLPWRLTLVLPPLRLGSPFNHLPSRTNQPLWTKEGSFVSYQPKLCGSGIEPDTTTSCGPIPRPNTTELPSDTMLSGAKG